MINKLVNKIKPFYYTYAGTRISDKIVVIESDDWGGIRMRSRESVERLNKAGIVTTNNAMNELDTLESEEDLVYLQQKLVDFEKKKGVKPVITTNTILANPDFDKIKQAKFESYFYERSEATYLRYFGKNKVDQANKELIDQGFCKPQFHGREHVNVTKWLEELRLNSEVLTAAFNEECFGLELNEKLAGRTNLMASWNAYNADSADFINASIKDGMQLFEEKFGFASKSSIAPANVWGNEAEQVLNNLGVQYIQGFVFQQKPVNEDNANKVYHKMGAKNNLNQRYLPRNCYFEPSTNQNIDWVTSCTKQIERAFLFKKPAIISMHRINFVGGISKTNREQSIAKFIELLNNIVKIWPDVQFYSTDQLGEHHFGK